MEKPKTPESIKKYSKDYTDRSWQDYTIAELGQWVHLLVKRSQHRTAVQKKEKDLEDAQNYLNMIQEYINLELRELQRRRSKTVNIDEKKII